jgi:hypothetical protein
MLATKFPFRIRLVNRIIILTEIMITVITILIGCTIYLDYISPGYLQSRTRTFVGWTVVGLITLTCLLRVVFMTCEFTSIKDNSTLYNAL